MMQPTIYRPTSILVIAILQFIFGGLGVLLDLWGGVSQFSGSNPGMFTASGQGQQMQKDLMREMETAMEKRLASYKAVSIALLVLDLALCGIMIAGGVGLVQMQPWGRTLTIVYAVFSLIMKVATIAFSALVTAPATKEVMGTMAMQMGPQGATFARMMDLMAGVATFIPVCFAIYPIVVLVIMLQPHVATALAEAKADTTGAWPARPEPPDYQDRFGR